ncbi:hypothetical protein [Candidatus Poriferisocius sp.]|uniref:hypothetical protein n=1 Tax=Candidatus Poriferisocius sp. TaxID=3101276 RepID=UPI003B01F93B
MTEQPHPPPRTPPTPTSADVFDQYMPIVLFLVLNSLVSLFWAIVAMTLWAIKAQVSRHRRGLPQGKVMPIIVVYLLVRGTLGIIYDSGEVYFGIGIGVKALAAVVLVISVLIRRNLVSYAFSFLLPLLDHIKSLPEYRRAMNRIALGVALVVFASVGFDTWLLRNASINKFVFIRMGTNWGASMATFLVIGFYLDRSLRRIPGFPGLMPLLEHRMVTLGKLKPPPDKPT